MTFAIAILVLYVMHQEISDKYVVEQHKTHSLDGSLNAALSDFVGDLANDGRRSLISVFRTQQETWLRLREELCIAPRITDLDRESCLTRLYDQRIEALRQGPSRNPETDPNWRRSLLPGEQIGVGGPSGSDYWAIARCGVASMSLSPGGMLTTTGRSQLWASDESLKLPSTVGGLDVQGDLNETQVTCRFVGGEVATVDFRLERPITEPGPCAGNFGVLMNVKVGSSQVITDRSLVGYCDLAIVASVSISPDSVDICTLSLQDDPDRNDPVNVLPKTSECTSTSLK